VSKAAVESDPEVHLLEEDPLVGKVLDGRFQIVEKLGAGGMGTVYKAIQSPLDRLVALKILKADYDSSRDPGFQRRFFLEASVTSKLRHPNTITVIDYGKTEDGIYYLAMEYVEGITLAQVLVSQGALSWTRCLNVAQQVCRSLREAHRAGIIHRDLKPANVMICTEETDQDLVKVLDFGLVKSFQADSPHKALEPAELTQAGVFLGSPQYMAPEQARNVADPRSDIYSLGVLLYQMLTGKPPFYAEQPIDVIVKHMKEPPPPFRTVRTDLEIPAEVEALVMKCLEKDPEQRFQSMDEVLDALRLVAGVAGGSGLFPGLRSNQATSPQPSGSGAFRQPGATGTTGVQWLPQSGVHKSPSGVHRGGSGAFQQGGSGAHRIAAPAEGKAETSSPGSVFSAARPVPRGRKVLPFAIFGASVAVGLVVVYLLMEGGRSPAPAVPPPPHSVATPQPEAPPQPNAAQGPAAPHPVRFRVLSDPLGAAVTMGGKPVGTTPFAFELTSGKDGSASAELVFELSGYDRATVTAAGTGPEVFVTQRLRKAPPPPKAQRPQDKKANPTKVTGYKDDPY